MIATSPAAEKGLQAGDVIVRFGQNRITSVMELGEGIDEARQADRSGILLLVQREGQNRFVQIPFVKKAE